MKEYVKVLILEDNIADADLIVRHLNKSGLSFITKIAENRKQFEESLDVFIPDIILSDYYLPAFNAVAAFKIVRDKNLRIPFIIVSGTIGEENAIMLLKEGVTDFISKNNLSSMLLKINRALKEAKELIEKEDLLKKLKIQTAALLRANEELEFQNAEKEKRTLKLLNANKELLAFNYISSHDLQEPVRKIQTFISILMDKESDTLTESGKKNLNRIHASATRMRQLIEDLLDFSKVNAMEHPYGTTDLRDIIEDVKSELSQTIIQKEAIFKINTLVPAYLIPLQFRQLICNLMRNSLKFANPDVRLQITIESRIIKNNEIGQLNLPHNTEALDYWNLSFKDNGIGFESQFNQSIFTIFKRLHHHEHYSGTGIGLAIVKKIVDNHNGIIIADGHEKKGVTFNIYIPIYEKSLQILNTNRKREFSL